MKAKLIVEGREFPIEINDPNLEKLLRPPKKTGYERVDEDCEYYYEHCEGGACRVKAYNSKSDELSYECANYYSDSTVAENNARADKLMRQLRRFAVEHRENELDWKPNICKYRIQYNWNSKRLEVDLNDVWQICGVFYFDSKKTANLAIETFHDELIWYFTEYKDSL